MIEALFGATVMFIALCALGVYMNRKANKQPPSDAEHYDMDTYHDTAQQLANSIKQRRAPDPPPANAGNRPDTMPIATATTTMFINSDGTTQFAIQWQNHIDPNKPVDPTGKLALAGLITGHAYYDSQIGN